MVDVYSDGELITDALAEANLAAAKSRDEIEERLASVRQQQAGAFRALDRYFAAFEEGSLSPTDCQERIGMLKARIEVLEAEERQLAREATYEPSESISAAEVAQWAEQATPGPTDRGLCAAERGSDAKPHQRDPRHEPGRDRSHLPDSAPGSRSVRFGGWVEVIDWCANREEP
ncbi:MAG: hypothetical protein GEU68_16200 [Actinobacteria bacterium]|nr:hypothetical protein [Actinomycetota bacterium]